MTASPRRPRPKRILNGSSRVVRDRAVLCAFLTLDHGAWLGIFGNAAKAVMVVLGNPLIAITMIKHDIRVGLNVPVRIYIYEGADGHTRVAYDLPSTLMSGLDDADVTEAARKLDAKLIALAETISGATA